MISFERTKDYKLIREIISHPRIYECLSDDGSPKREEYQPIESDSFWYVLVRDKDEVMGLFLLVPQNTVCWEIHTALLPCSWGPKAIVIGKQMVQWVWENTPCKRLITNVPEYNTLAFRFARHGGLRQFAVNASSYLKNGILHDQIMLGITSPEVKKCL